MVLQFPELQKGSERAILPTSSSTYSCHRIIPSSIHITGMIMIFGGGEQVRERVRKRGRVAGWHGGSQAGWQGGMEARREGQRAKGNLQKSMAMICARFGSDPSLVFKKSKALPAVVKNTRPSSAVQKPVAGWSVYITAPEIIVDACVCGVDGCTIEWIDGRREP